MRAVAALPLLLACAPGPPPAAPAQTPVNESQSYAAAVQLICDVDRLAAVDPNDALSLEAKRSDYLMEHLHNGDGIYLVTLYRVKDAKERSTLLAEAVADTKLPACTLLTTLQREASTAVEPSREKLGH